MSGASQMPADVEERIRALPGNDTCADCSNVTPQWASVSYGILVCLECSGQHRSLGVHLSFVRSVAMDSWTEKQIAAMEKSGGNEATVSYFRSKGIEQSMPVARKYNTPQAAYLRDRLSRWLEGKTEPPPDPGSYDPATGGGDAQGAEPLPGETTEEYNERQARLKEQAKERMRAKFGDGLMGGMGSEPDPGDSGAMDAAADAARAAKDKLGSALTGGLGFLKSNVIDNKDLHDKVKGTAGGALESMKGATAGAKETTIGVWGSLKKSVEQGDLLDKVKKNATAEEGSAVRKGFGWGMGAATSLWAKASDVVSGTQKPCDGEHQLHVDPRPDAKCELCNVKGTRYACSRGCEYYICPKCFEKPPPAPAKASKAGAGDFDDDGGWGDWDDEKEDKPPPAEPTADDMARIAKELGMSLNSEEPPKAEAAAAPASLSLDAAAKPKPAPKAKPKDEDDFFADFGVS